MRRKILVMLIVLFIPKLAVSQIHDGIGAILKVMGVGSEEEADSQEVERLEGLLVHPLRINQVSYSTMMESGLFSHYQIVSLTEYRKRHGDILSIAELSAVDGFGAAFTEVLAPFISLESGFSPGCIPYSSKKTEHDLMFKGAYKTNVDASPQWNYGLKYKVSVLNKFYAAAAVSRPYGDSGSIMPETFTGHLSWRFKRKDGLLIVGDFNARFAQGLTMWSGMSLSGLAEMASFYRRASELSPSWSFSGSSSMTGIAGKCSFGHLDFSAFAALPGIRGKENNIGLLPGINLSYNLGNVRMGATHYALFTGISGPSTRIPDMKSSLDCRCCIRGTDLWSEVAYDWVASSAAFLMGSAFRTGENLRMAIHLRMYPSEFNAAYSAAPRSGTRCSNEYGSAVAGEWTAGGSVKIRGHEGFGSSVPKHSGSFSVDVVCFPETKSSSVPRSMQLKSRISWEHMLNDALCLGVRLNVRLRNWEECFSKTELRSEVTWMPGKLFLAARINGMLCAALGLLGYVEAGYKGEKLSAYFRQGIFRIDNWDDRIYVYERDAPGNFSVPSYYGRGVWSALALSWRFSSSGRLYLRAASTSYPFMSGEKKKPGKAELKLQMEFSF